MTTMVALRMIAEYARLQEACAAEFRRFAKTAREAGDAELVGATSVLGVSLLRADSGDGHDQDEEDIDA